MRAPPLFAALRQALRQGYTASALRGDVSAGLTVGIIAIPLAMALAIAVGVPPQHGLYTVLVAAPLIALTGGSRFNVSGPTAAFVVILLPITQQFGIGGLLLCTMLAGLILIALGLLRAGRLIAFIPYPVTLGFTAGIGVVIATLQIKDLLGLQLDGQPQHYVEQLLLLARSLPGANLGDALVAAICLAVLILWPRWVPKIPGHLVALALGAVAGLMLEAAGLPVATLGERFSYELGGQTYPGIPPQLPAPVLPWHLPGPDGVALVLSYELFHQLLGPAFAIAMLGAIESLLCARVADQLSDTPKHDPNQELMAQGVANIASPLFGGFCATGTIARTVTNIKSGARTPVAGMVHALVLLVIVLGAAPLAEMIPLVSLAATALVVAYNMGEWHSFANMRQYSPPYRITLLTTFALTVIIDITVAVEVGLVLAGVFFIRRMSQLTKVEHVSREELEAEGIDTKHLINTEVKRLTGVLFFGAVSKIEPLLDPRRKFAPVMVLDLTALLAIDSTGIDAIKTLDESLAARGVELRLTHIRPVVLSTMTRWGLISHFGEKRVFPTLRGALGLA